MDVPPSRSERLAALAGAALDAMVVIDQTGDVLFATDSIEGLLGVTPEGLRGRNIVEFVHPDDLAETAAALTGLVEGPVIRDPVLRAIAADGAERLLMVSGVDRRDDPAIGGFALTLRRANKHARADRHMRTVMRNASGAAIVVDEHGWIVWSTPGVERFIGDTLVLHVDALGDVFEESRTPVAVTAAPPAPDDEQPSKTMVGRMGPGPEKVWVDITVTDALDDEDIQGTIIRIRDIDATVRAEDRGLRMFTMLETSADLVCMLDDDLNRIWANRAARTLLGPAALPRADVLEQLSVLRDPTTLASFRLELTRTGVWHGELTAATVGGGSMALEATFVIHSDTDGRTHLSMTARDVSERNEMAATLRAESRHDPMTGLPNRVQLTERIERELVAGTDFAILFIDLDDLRTINKSHGHEAGDQLLVTAAERLRAALRPTDLATRFGADEFVVVLPGITDEQDALDHGERVLAALRGPARAGPITVYLTASAGVALNDGGGAGALIANADAAKYQAKVGGRDRIEIFTPSIRQQSRDRLRIAQLLRDALDAGRLDLWFQPVLDLATGEPLLAEGLTRWDDTELSAVPTDVLIAAAEETDLIRPLGRQVIDRACRLLSDVATSAPELVVAVNLSAVQLDGVGLVEELAQAFDHHGVAPERMVCEITESSVMRDVDAAAGVLGRIRALGCEIALDDFGTGYSSLAYLHQLPVDVLKIDAEFVRALDDDCDPEQSLAAGIVNLGHSLGLRIVAEGVETETQIRILTELGCDALQGFGYAHPVPGHELVPLLDQLRGSPNRPG